MRRILIGALFAATTGLAATGAAPEDEAGRIANWAAPPFWSSDSIPAGAKGAAGRTAEGRTALVGGVTALPFIALPPCRIIDTRGNAPLTGGFLPAATVRSYTVTGVCGIPANAQALSLNATVVHPTGPGFLTLWPQGGAFPPVSTLNYLGNDVIVNAAVVPISGGGGISMALGVSGGDVILDTNGYYAVADVTSLNTLIGDVTLAAGSNITITPAGNTLTIASPGGTGVTSLSGTNGISASPSTGAVTVTSNATNLNTVSTIVSRDGAGSFAAQSATFFGNVNLPNTTAGFAGGTVVMGGLNFLHGYGGNNTFLGRQAGNTTMTGTLNTGVGSLALISNTTGGVNNAFGTNALDSNTTGSGNAAFGSAALHANVTGNDNAAFGNDALSHNTASGNSAFGRTALTANTTGTNGAAFGHNALLANTTGSGNSAFGTNALQANVSGGFNTAVGGSALFSSTGGSNTAVGNAALNLMTSGNGNIAIGSFAGTSLTTGSNNIYLGADLPSSGSESNVIRIGNGQTATVIAGIYNAAIGGSGLAVSVNSSGQLGTTSSSRRYKEEIVDIAGESDVLMKLRPVAYFYKPEYDPTHTRQYGLIAEEVEELAPGLVARDANGRVETVRYPLVNALLLNEVQKSRRMLDELRAERDTLVQRLDAIERRLAARGPAGN
jgi:hypothetical protein